MAKPLRKPSETDDEFRERLEAWEYHSIVYHANAAMRCEKSRAYYAANAERLRQYARDYRLLHKDEIMKKRHARLDATETNKD